MYISLMFNFLTGPWPWYLSGGLIALTMVSLLFFGKSLGVSGTLRATCSAGGAGRWIDFFKFDWKSAQGWNLLFIVGAVIGGFVASKFMMVSEPMEIAPSTIEYVESIGLSKPSIKGDNMAYMPDEFLNQDFIFSWKGILVFVLGGFLVGFGARYAGGCTSGHGISGLSNLQLPSLIAIIGFFMGGMLITYFVLPLLFG